jgi:hypothetical protein
MFKKHLTVSFFIISFNPIEEGTGSRNQKWLLEGLSVSRAANWSFALVCGFFLSTTCKQTLVPRSGKQHNLPDILSVGLSRQSKRMLWFAAFFVFDEMQQIAVHDPGTNNQDHPSVLLSR